MHNTCKYTYFLFENLGQNLLQIDIALNLFTANVLNNVDINHIYRSDLCYLQNSSFM